MTSCQWFFACFCVSLPNFICSPIHMLLLNFANWIDYLSFIKSLIIHNEAKKLNCAKRLMSKYFDGLPPAKVWEFSKKDKRKKEKIKTIKCQSPADTKNIFLDFCCKGEIASLECKYLFRDICLQKDFCKGGRVSLSIPQGESLFVMRTPLRFSKTWNDTSPLGYLKL